MVWRLNVIVRYVSTLHCTLENGADLYVNECQKINTIALGLLKKEEEEERIPNRDFLLRAAST